jgi:diadenosine tetraphosphate (Ap4A) HIT family hydrolase
VSEGRRQLDWEAYLSHVRSACFVCKIVAGDPAYPHHVVYEDGDAIAFMNQFPTLRGQTLVAPREHRERVTGDFSLGEYLALQRVLYRVAEAVRRAFNPERLYLVSLGSQQANRHVHWHVAPLPAGVPFEEQQAEALEARRGILDLSDAELATDAARIREQLGFRS